MNTFLFSEKVKFESCSELSLLYYLLSKVYILSLHPRNLHTQPFVTHWSRKYNAFTLHLYNTSYWKYISDFLKITSQILSTIKMNHLLVMVSWIWFSFLQVCELQMFLIIFLLHFGVLFIQDGLSFTQ